MNKKAIVIASTLLFSSFMTQTQAQQVYGGGRTLAAQTWEIENQCNLVTEKDQYKLLIAATMIDDVATVEVLLKNYCYDLSYFKKHNMATLPIFGVKSLEMLNLLTTYFDFSEATYSGLKMDPLMAHYIQPTFLTPVEEQISSVKDIKEAYKKMNIPFLYNQSDEQIASNLRFKMIVNKDKIFNALLEKSIESQKEKEQKKKIYAHYDRNGNEILHYIIYMGDVVTLEKLLNEPAYNLAKKTRLISPNSKLSPLSLVFNIKQVYKNPETQQKLVSRINDLVLSEVLHSKMFLKQPNLYGNTIFQLSYIMRDRNPDFYLKLRAMFPKEEYIPKDPKVAREAYLKDSDLFGIVKKWILED